MDEHQREQEGSAAARGAWYVDPFEIAAQRWWDGGKWTDAVRDATEGDAAGAHSAPTIRAPRDPRPLAMASEPSDFTLCMRDVVGDTLRVVPTDRRSPRQLGRNLGMGRSRAWRLGEALAVCQDFELVAPREVVASLCFGEEALARLACADGAWFLDKRR